MPDPRTHALATTARTLIGNGHLTSSTIHVVEDLGQRLGRPVECLVEWSHISLVEGEGTTLATVHVQPEAINMTKVSSTLRALDALPEHPGDADVDRLNRGLDQAAEAPAPPPGCSCWPASPAPARWVPSSAPRPPWATC